MLFIPVLKNSIEVWQCDMYSTADSRCQHLGHPCLTSPLCLTICRYGDASYVHSAPEIDCGTSCERIVIRIVSPHGVHVATKLDFPAAMLCVRAAITAKRIFSVFSFVLYVLGVPLAYTAIIMYGRRRKLLSDGQFQMKFGFM